MNSEIGQKKDDYLLNTYVEVPGAKSRTASSVETDSASVISNAQSCLTQESKIGSRTLKRRVETTKKPYAALYKCGIYLIFIVSISHVIITV